MFLDQKSVNATFCSRVAIFSLYSQATTANNHDSILGGHFPFIKAGEAYSQKLNSLFKSDDIETGYVAGVKIGRKFMQRFALSLKYKYRTKTNETHFNI